MAYIWSYLRRYPKWLAMNFTAAILFVIANLGLPTVLARMIDEGINRGDVDKLYAYAWVMFGVVLTGIVGRILLSYAVGKLTTTMVQVMRNDIYAKLQEYSHHEYEQIGVSSLVTRITSDAFVLMQFADQVLKLGVITPLMMVSSVFLILTTSPSLAWIVAISLPFLAVVVWYVAVKTRPLSEKQQATLDKINQYARENLTGLRVIRAFAREDFQEKKFASENAVYADNSSKLFKLTGLTEPLFVQIIIAMIVAIVWFALEPLGSGTLAIGDLVAFIEYSFHALLSFLFLANLFTMYPRTAVSSERLQEIMDMPISINPNEDGVTETETAIKSLKEPNLVAVFIGIILGLALGAIPISLPGISAPVKLGLAGGPIIVGILIGTFGPRMHMITYTTRSANLMLRALGLSLYLACLGLDAGAHFFDTVFRPEGLLWIAAGFTLTVVPVLIVGVIAFKWMKVDFGSMAGMLCGSMANPMALNYANDTIPGDNPSVAYATVYPMCMFLRVIIAQVLLMFLLS